MCFLKWHLKAIVKRMLYISECTMYISGRMVYTRHIDCLQIFKNYNLHVITPPNRIVWPQRTPQQRRRCWPRKRCGRTPCCRPHAHSSTPPSRCRSRTRPNCRRPSRRCRQRTHSGGSPDASDRPLNIYGIKSLEFRYLHLHRTTLLHRNRAYK